MSALWPYRSCISLRSRRAAAPVSSSASTTTRPPTMCRPPAKRSSDDTSARRQQVFDTASLLNSSLTAAVIATWPLPSKNDTATTPMTSLPPESSRLPRTSHHQPTLCAPSSRVYGRQYIAQALRERLRIVPLPRLGGRHPVQPQPRPERLRRPSQPVGCRYRVGVGDHRVDPQAGSVLAEYVQVTFRGEA